MQCNNNKPCVIPECEENDDSCLECFEEEHTDYEDFIVVTPKRQRKPNKKFLLSIATEKAKNSSKEIPCSSIGVEHQGISGVSRKASKKNKKGGKT